MLLDPKNGALESLFSYNSDGVGVMYKNKKGLRVRKIVPTTIQDVDTFLLSLPDDDRNLAIHFRMATHGDINLDNCHPYAVTETVAMMHNGVLSTGNAADKSRSDTWHFINDYLRQTVEAFPGIIHQEQFNKLVARYIGNNRFVYMDENGGMSHVNKKQGFEHDGMWFANTYSFDASTVGYAEYIWEDEDEDDSLVYPFGSKLYKPKYTKSSSWGKFKPSPAPYVSPQTASTAGVWDEVKAAALLGDLDFMRVDSIAAVLEQLPFSAVTALMRTHRPVVGASYQVGETCNTVSAESAGIVRMLFAFCAEIEKFSYGREEATKLAEKCRRTPADAKEVASVMSYYLSWEKRNAPIPVGWKAAPAPAPAPRAATMDTLGEIKRRDCVHETTYGEYTVSVYSLGAGAYGYEATDSTGSLVAVASGYSSLSEAYEEATIEVETLIVHG
jgi:predicted glutamine amidotransferase